MSLATIGALWLGYNAITYYLDRADTTLLRLNPLLLLLVAFLPFPTRLVSEYVHVTTAQAERVAVTFYGLTLLISPLSSPCSGDTRCTPGSSGPTPETTRSPCSPTG